MTPREVIAYFGNQNRTAIALEISREAVRKWVDRGAVPKLRQYQIEKVTKGALKADD